MSLLSVAKNLFVSAEQILRCAQDDTGGNGNVIVFRIRSPEARQSVCMRFAQKLKSIHEVSPNDGGAKMNRFAIVLSVVAVMGLSAVPTHGQKVEKAGATAKAGQRPVDLYNVGSEKQLFIDGAFFEKAENVRIRLHPARKTGEKTLEREHPWESLTINWFNVMEDPGVVDKQARYRMWYEAYDVDGWLRYEKEKNDNYTIVFCYAESRDGIKWTKPELGLFEYEYNGSKKNNILFRTIGPEGANSRVHGVGVFKDPTAPPESRYKGASQGRLHGQYRIAGMYSADGLRWTRWPKPIVTNGGFADSQHSCFWDQRRGKYVLYARGGGIRESDDFSCFEKGIDGFSFRPGRKHPPKSTIYNHAAMKYPYAANVYLALPSLYSRPKSTPDTLEIYLAVSRDGARWTWPDSPVPFIALGKPDTFDSGSLYMGQGIIRVGDELWLYYSGSPLTHNESSLEKEKNPKNARIYSRVIVPLDRFVSVDSGTEGGYFVTPPLTFTGNTLKLNVEVREGGSARVGLLTEDGKPVPGRTVEDCLPITGDQMATPVRWRKGGDVSPRAGKPTRLRVELKSASLYAFQFDQPQPARD